MAKLSSGTRLYSLPFNKWRIELQTLPKKKTKTLIMAFHHPKIKAVIRGSNVGSETLTGLADFSTSADDSMQ